MWSKEKVPKKKEKKWKMILYDWPVVKNYIPFTNANVILLTK